VTSFGRLAEVLGTNVRHGDVVTGLKRPIKEPGVRRLGPDLIAVEDPALIANPHSVSPAPAVTT